MSGRISVAAVLFVTFAGCGGKTEAIDPLGSGGSGVGGSATGGSSTGGGNTGGSNTGGSNTGGANTGGSGGGLTLDQKAKAFCAKAAKLPCPAFDCEEELKQAVDLASQEGCFKEFESVIDCALGRPLSCSPGGEPELAPECDPVLDKFGDCISGTSACSIGGSPDGYCDIQCDAWGGKCAPQGGGLYCVCTHGPNPNGQATFALTCGSPNWQSQVEALCN